MNLFARICKRNDFSSDGGQMNMNCIHCSTVLPAMPGWCLCACVGVLQSLFLFIVCYFQLNKLFLEDFTLICDDMMSL